MDSCSEISKPSIPDGMELCGAVDEASLDWTHGKVRIQQPGEEHESRHNGIRVPELCLSRPAHAVALFAAVPADHH